MCPLSNQQKFSSFCCSVKINDRIGTVWKIDKAEHIVHLLKLNIKAVDEYRRI